MATTRRRTRRRTAPKPVQLPTPGVGERLWVLDTPFGVNPDGTVWHPGLKARIWVGGNPPGHLRGYLSQPYTYERFVEDQLNGQPGPGWVNPPQMTPRPLQVEAATMIAGHAHSGAPLFLLASEPGTGKTLAAVLAVKAVAKMRRVRRVLVVADRPAQITIGHWGRTIAAAGDGGLTWVVVTWDRLAKVADDSWDVVIGDEAHMVRSTTTKRWKAWCKITGHNRGSGAKPYLLLATATPAHTPLELPYLAPAYHHRLGGDRKQWASDFAAALTTHGLHINRGRYGAEWTDDLTLRARDQKAIRGWLSDSTPPAMLYRAAPWGGCAVEGLPVRLTAPERATYEADWATFCAEMELAARGRNSAAGRAALLRFRQKAGLLRAGVTVAWVQAQIDAGKQVAVSTQFVATAAQPIADQLQAAGVEVARIFGGVADPEAERLRFQLGRAPVVVFTPTASLSLHASEVLSGDRVATSSPRVGLFHQPRYSGIQGRQVTGRTHRDYQRCDWFVAFAEDTVEEQVAKVMIERYAATGEAVGGDTSALRSIAALLRADWMPVSELADGE